MDGSNANPGIGCPVMHGGNTSTDNSVTKWWPESLNLDILHQKGARTNPMDVDYDHRAAVKALDFEAVKERGIYLEELFFPEVPALIEISKKNKKISEIRSKRLVGFCFLGRKNQGN